MSIFVAFSFPGMKQDKVSVVSIISEMSFPKRI